MKMFRYALSILLIAISFSVSVTTAEDSIPLYSNIIWQDKTLTNNLEFSNTDKYLVCYTATTAVFRNARTGDTLKIFITADSSSSSIVFNNDDSQFYAFGPNRHYVCRYDTKTFNLIDTVAFSDNGFTSFKISPDYSKLISVINNTVYLWDISDSRNSDLKPIKHLKDTNTVVFSQDYKGIPSVNNVEFTPDSKQINVRYRFARNVEISYDQGVAELHYIFHIYKILDMNLDSVRLGIYSSPFYYDKNSGILTSFYNSVMGATPTRFIQEALADGCRDNFESFSDRFYIYNLDTKTGIDSIISTKRIYNKFKIPITPDEKFLIIPDAGGYKTAYHYSYIYNIEVPTNPFPVCKIAFAGDGNDVSSINLSHSGKLLVHSDKNGAFMHYLDPDKFSSVKDQNLASCSVFPNPASENTLLEINLNSPEFLTIELFDAAGTKINTIAEKYFAIGNNQIYIDARELSSGAYFVKINGKYANITQKLIIEK